MTDSALNSALIFAVEDAGRLAALDRTGLLDAGPDETFDRLTRLATRIVRAPIALVSLVTPERQVFAGAAGLPEPVATARETPLSRSFCQQTVLTRGPLIVTDSRQDARVSGNPVITELGVVAYAGFPLLSDDGEVLGAFCVIDHVPRDWTDDDLATVADLAAAATTEIRLRLAVAGVQAELAAREAAEAALARAHVVEADDRRAADELQQAFLDGVAHDLRNPLAAVKGQAQLLLRQITKRGGVEPDRLLVGLRGIDASVEQMTAQIAELQDVARLRSGHPLALRARPTDLAALVQAAAEGARQISSHHRISVAATPPTLIGRWDAPRLRRVIDNLLGNAVKYSPGGGDIAVVAAAEERPDGRWARLEVRDTGVGIPAAELGRIFERFRRGSNVAGRFRGTGIGLSGARQIVEQHGGAIAIVSDEGRGTVVTVTLPLTPPP